MVLCCWHPCMHFIMMHVFIVNSHIELGPLFFKQPNRKYILNEVFSQDPLEKYFSRQRHRGGGADNPTIEQLLPLLFNSSLYTETCRQ